MNPIAQWLTRSLARRITVLVSVLLLALGAGSLAISYFQVIRVTERIFAERMETVGSQLSALLIRGPREMSFRLTRLGTNPVVLDALARRDTSSAGPARVLLQQALTSDRSVIALFDLAGGRVIEAGAAGHPGWYGGDPLGLTGTLSDSVARFGPFVRRSDSTMYYDVMVPVRRGSMVIGALLQRNTMMVNPETRSTFAWLLGSNTSLVLGSPSNGVWTDLGALASAPPPAALPAGQVNSYTWDGLEYVGYTQEIAGTPWVLITRSPRTEVMAPARDFLGRAILLIVLLVILGALVAAIIGRRLSRPIEEMTQVTEAIAAGDHDRRANAHALGEVGRLGASFNTMVERVNESTARLRQSEESLRGFVNRSGEGIWRMELAGGLDPSLAPERQLEQCYQARVECNLAMARMLGQPPDGELAPVALERVFPKNGGPNRILLDFVRRGYRLEGAESRTGTDGHGTRVFLDDLIGIVDGGRLRRIWGTRRDVTLERMVDERITQTQRLESIGRLAGGVAHDFNNLLTVVLGYAESLMERLLHDGQARREADEIRITALKAAELSRQLLAFSRGQVLQLALLDLNAMLSGMEPILRRVLGEDIALQLQLDPELDCIEADPGQIERVVMNLVVNARDAMPSGGSVKVRTAIVELDAADVRSHPTLGPDRYILLSIGDTGTGMTDDVKQHAFEPFFSTKSKGKGHGLGLATVYGIVRQSNGEITLYSELGYGTEFKVLLPAKVGAAPPSVTHVAAVDQSAPARGETILLVEDEPAVLAMAEMALTEAGYTVLPASDGQQALQISAERSGVIDLVLTDMVMPGMNGRELVRALRQTRPDIRVIISSGYSGETHPALDSMPVTESYLEKPFLLSKLRRRVREVLDAPRYDGH